MKLQKRIETRLKSYEQLQKGDTLNIRYFVSLHFVLKNREYKAKEITNLSQYIEDFNNIGFEEETDQEIDNSIAHVLSNFISKGRTDGVAKAKHFTDSIVDSLMNDSIY